MSKKIFVRYPFLIWLITDAINPSANHAQAGARTLGTFHYFLPFLVLLFFLLAVLCRLLCVLNFLLLAILFGTLFLLFVLLLFLLAFLFGTMLVIAMIKVSVVAGNFTLTIESRVYPLPLRPIIVSLQKLSASATLLTICAAAKRPLTVMY